MVSSDHARTDATRIDVLVADMVAAFVRSGGVWGDSAVVSVRVVVELGTGETLRTGHRRCAPVAATSPPELKPQQRRIVETLRASPVPMKRGAVARAMGLKDERGGFGVNVSSLLDTGIIFERDGMIADDETKFDDGS